MESLKQLAVDHDALERGLALALADDDPTERRRMREKLRDVEKGLNAWNTWQAVAEFRVLPLAVSKFGVAALGMSAHAKFAGRNRPRQILFQPAQSGGASATTP